MSNAPAATASAPPASARPATAGKPAPGRTAAAAAAPRSAPQAARPATSSAFDGEIDFRSIPVPALNAPSGNFPVVGQIRPYDGPIALDPIPKQSTGDEAEDDDEDVQTSAANQKKSSQAKVVAGLIGGLVCLVAVGGAAFWMMGGGGGSSGETVDLAAAAAAAAPSGFQAKSLNNCVVLMPKGSWGDGKKAIPSSIESEVVMSDATSSVFVLAVMDGGSQPLDKEQMRKKASRSLGGDILGGQSVERNGYQGIKGVLDGSVFLPRMSVEIFHHDGRFAIIGHAFGSDMQSRAGGEASFVSAEEQKEAEVFLNSFKIGPPKGGFFSN
ncbi:MAG: hypothetical protein ACO1RT_15520 [Planctomycetaceae bacterium]